MKLDMTKVANDRIDVFERDVTNHGIRKIPLARNGGNMKSTVTKREAKPIGIKTSAGTVGDFGDLDDVIASMMTPEAGSEGKPSDADDWMLRRMKPFPYKRKQRVRPHAFGFRRRTLVFTACVLVMFAFVWWSFVTGAGNGGQIVSMSQSLMSVTFGRLNEAIAKATPSVTVATVFRGMTNLVCLDIVSIILAIFLCSVVLTLVITIVADIVITAYRAMDDGNVAMMRGYQKRYEMYRKLR